MATTERFTEEGFSIGDVYTIVDKKTTELIPTWQISYVSAKYNSNPFLLVIGLALFAFGLYGALNGSNSVGAGLLFCLVGAALFVAFFLTRRVGIVIASSGGKIFIETRGRRRFALLEEIRADLALRS